MDKDNKGSKTRRRTRSEMVVEIMRSPVVTQHTTEKQVVTYADRLCTFIEGGDE